ncbi:STAS domain-containing protein [Niallia taxi]|uniref:STAS domain-containing protein n=1 Tax=Niallia taxi TaxID=2499688 RepID=A0A3S2UC85_9BACI|nr:STAS domain-containing protein [Niallia taxi]MCM3218143.1 STAS domain-containing protein [Niallia taxi]MDK8643408.1 STAS domain-containing protein [Niallia taxi]MED4038325.1 STAS domain-containing protein [Niallia taxi]MED4056386.1 STAS domain-containing protein [Niallia taxi]MED4120442.1 STAS domain-containing protein [Niallia taxi]
MGENIKHLGNVLLQQKREIALTVHKRRLEGESLKTLQEIRHVEEELLRLRAHFISLFGQSLLNQDFEGSLSMFSDWGINTGASLSAQGVPLDEALKDVAFYRRAIWEVLKKEMKEKDFSIDEVFEVKDIIDPLLDFALYNFSLSYVDSYTNTLNNSRRAFLELSVPVVPITNDIAILPLIGDIDTERAQLLMEETLIKTRDMGINHLIIDISGVVIIDTMVANELFKLMDALRLLGVATIFSGVRPEIAQTMVNLGLNTKDLVTKASLRQALALLERENIK